MSLTLKGGSSGALLEVGALTLAARASLWPNDVGTLGAYRKALTSGTIGAGISGGSTVFSARYGGPNIAVVRRIAISLGDLVGFTAGIVSISGFVARAFTASDSGGTAGTLSGNNAKLKTGFATTGMSDVRIANTGALTPGTRSLDTDPFCQLVSSVITTAGQPIAPGMQEIFRANPGDWPLVLANNEGLAVLATVPATGTWVIGVDLSWDEYPVGTF